MNSLLFAFFLISLKEPSVCENKVAGVEDFYQEILISPNDPKVKRKYLEKFGKCFESEGINLFEVKNVPIVEILDCSPPFKKLGAELFFNKNRKLCSKSVMLFPSKKVFLINEFGAVLSVAENWKTITTGETVLFYDTTASFEEGSDPDGRKLNKNSFGVYTNHMGKPEYPFFIYESGEWKTLFPLRELFELIISDDNSFEISMITESPVSYDSARFIETSGLKASEIEVNTPSPNSYFVKGKSLKGVRIPKLIPVKTTSGFHGTYIVRILHKALKKGKPIEIKEKNYSLTISQKKGKTEFVLILKQKSLSSEELHKIQAIFQKQIPSFYVIKEHEKPKTSK
ncbi:MAG: hypothetical protein ACOX2F_04235 [bacterium]